MSLPRSWLPPLALTLSSISQGQVRAVDQQPRARWLHQRGAPRVGRWRYRWSGVCTEEGGASEEARVLLVLYCPFMLRSAFWGAPSGFESLPSLRWSFRTAFSQAWIAGNSSRCPTRRAACVGRLRNLEEHRRLFSPLAPALMSAKPLTNAAKVSPRMRMRAEIVGHVKRKSA